MDWQKAPQSRDQMVLFAQRLDEVVSGDAPVRVLEMILQQINWSPWETGYDLKQGRPPIHPRVLAGILLYGLLVGIRSSRKLEEALKVRVDFMWLVEGRTVDHSTISEFRRKHRAALADLFVQIGLVSRELGHLPLQTLAFDGTRIRANNRRSGTRTPKELRRMKEELREKFEKAEKEAAQADDQERFDFALRDQELADLQCAQKRIDWALEEVSRWEAEEMAVPKRIPTTDPQSRVMPNKEGGFAPNYTPLITVDVDSGLIVAGDVINSSREDKHLVPAVEKVRQQFDLDPSEGITVLADGLMATGDNLADCEKHQINLYSPLPGQHEGENPAIREDPTQPVPEEAWDKLPCKTIRRRGVRFQQLDKQAFVYDKERDLYWCPLGKPLKYRNTTTETVGGRRRQRHRYGAAAEDCATCPLRGRCVQGETQSRTVQRGDQEPFREAHAKKMASEEAQAQYVRRCHVVERPFAVIKHQFGARRFLLRGLEKVQTEWLWLICAFNMALLIGWMGTGVDPP